MHSADCIRVPWGLIAGLHSFILSEDATDQRKTIFALK